MRKSFNSFGCCRPIQSEDSREKFIAEYNVQLEAIDVQCDMPNNLD